MADEQTNEQQEQEAQEPQYPNVVTITDAGPCKKKVAIEVPPEAIKAAIEKDYAELKKEAVVPGFRRGRAPMRLLEKRFGTDIRTQVKLKLLAEASDKAVTDNKIQMLGDPDIDYEKVELPETGAMKFEFEVEVRPEFELPSLEGIEIERPRIEVTDAQVDEELLFLQRQAGVWTPKEGPAAADDQVVADVILVTEGADGAKGQEKLDNTEIFVHERSFVGPVPVEGLAVLLTGAVRGDVKKTTTQVPETFFNEQYRGKKADLEIAVKEVKRLEPAELNADFLKRYGVDTEQELKDAIRSRHQSQAEQDARTAMSEQVMEYLREHTQLDLPAGLVGAQSTRILQRRYVSLLMQQVPKEQIDQKMQELRAGSVEQATEQLKQYFIMDRVAQTLGIEVTDEEVNGYVATVAAQRGRRPEKMREELARDGSLDEFRLQIREHKCIEKILEKAKISEVEPEKVRKRVPRKAAKTAKRESPAKEEEPQEVKEEEGGEDTAKARKAAGAKRVRKAPKKGDKEEK